MQKAKIIHLVCCVLVLFLFSGCKNPFRTRSSPPPSGQVGTWSTPSKPEIVLENLMHSYNEKIIENFNLCLSDSFVFSAPEDSIEMEYLFSDWDKSTEKMVTTNIFNVSKQHPDSVDFILSFDFDNIQRGETTDSTEVLSVSYTLSIFRYKPKEELIKAEGISTFHLKDSGLNWWSIYFWEDLPKSSGGYSWADFKGEYRY